MNGLEKILKDINDDTQTECNKILSEAKKQAEIIIKTTDNEAVKISEAEEQKLKILENELNSRSQSAAKIEKQKILLEEKQKIIDNIILKTYNKILSLPDKEYFEFLMKIAVKNIGRGNGKILFNSRDLKRIPNNFISQLDAQAQKVGGSIILSEKTTDIKGGFVLNYGGIEENCSLDALFYSRSEEMKDIINSLIFVSN